MKISIVNGNAAAASYPWNGSLDMLKALIVSHFNNKIPQSFLIQHESGHAVNFEKKNIHPNIKKRPMNFNLLNNGNLFKSGEKLDDVFQEFKALIAWA